MLKEPSERFRRLLQSYEGRNVIVHIRGRAGPDDFVGLAMGWSKLETQNSYEIRLTDGSLAVLEGEDEVSLAGIHSAWQEECPLCRERR